MVHPHRPYCKYMSKVSIFNLSRSTDPRRFNRGSSASTTHPRNSIQRLLRFLGGSGGTDTKFFRRCLVLLRIYSSPAASRATSTCCESTPSPLIVLPMYLLHFSSFSLGSTLTASFSIMLDTSTPHPKMLFFGLHVQDFESDAMWCVCIVTTDTDTLPSLQVSFELLASFDMMF